MPNEILKEIQPGMKHKGVKAANEIPIQKRGNDNMLSNSTIS